jgi:hypothetical protein
MTVPVHVSWLAKKINGRHERLGTSAGFQARGLVRHENSKIVVVQNTKDFLIFFAVHHVINADVTVKNVCF